MFPHLSVLLSEWLSFFDKRPMKTYVDCTLGAGGHAEAVLQAHPELEKMVGFDQDPEALEIAGKRLAPWQNKIILIQDNFNTFHRHLDELKISQVDGILFDLGVSSMQLDKPERGFSFMREGPLDMRMNPEESLTAQEIVNTWNEQELGRIFRDYGEEKRWRQAARAIVNARKQGPLHSTIDLVNALKPAFPPYSPRGINPATLIFQALRITVNGELEVIQRALPKAIEYLAPGGVLGVISFHSLEDRIVKNVFRDAASDKMETSGLGVGLFISKKPQVSILTRKPLTASKPEIESNPRSRSAKLRVVEKI